jgi:hypothetical protein
VVLPLSPSAVVDIAVQAAENKKAVDVKVLDISSVSIIADYFIICSGRSSTQVQAIAEGIQEDLKASGKPTGCCWIMVMLLSMFSRKQNGSFTTWNACGVTPGL